MSKIEVRVEIPEYDIAEGVGREVVPPHCAKALDRVDDAGVGARVKERFSTDMGSTICSRTWQIVG